MENRNRISQFGFMLCLLLTSSIESSGQMTIKTKPDLLPVFDTLKIVILNQIKKSGYYYMAWQIFERKKWRMAKGDIWNDVPMTEKWNKIQPEQNEEKHFIIENIFDGYYKKYKQLPARLVLTFSYSDELEPKRIVYSKRFIVKSKQ